jgi:hypothetical protein
VTAGEGVQPGCMMKILEAERWLKGTNFHEVAFLQRQGGRIAGVPLKGKCALGPFLCILVIECQHMCLIGNLCTWMNKVKIMK